MVIVKAGMRFTVLFILDSDYCLKHHNYHQVSLVPVVTAVGCLHIMGLWHRHKFAAYHTRCSPAHLNNISVHNIARDAVRCS